MRHAIYFTPPADDPLTRRAADWLGRDAFTGELRTLRPMDRVTAAERADWTEDARRYGFHATIKAPFRLAEGASADELAGVLRDYGASTPPLTVPSLAIVRMRGFFALASAGPTPELDALAFEVVRRFDRFRAPLSEAERERRRPGDLDAEERANLDRWGYPHVAARFRFHMTLTGAVPADRVEAVETLLAAHFAEFIGRPLEIGALSLFAQPDVSAPFRVWKIVPLTGKRA